MADSEVLIPVDVELNYAEALKKAKDLEKKLEKLTERRDIDVGMRDNFSEDMADLKKKLQAEKDKLSQMVAGKDLWEEGDALEKKIQSLTSRQSHIAQMYADYDYKENTMGNELNIETRKLKQMQEAMRAAREQAELSGVSAKERDRRVAQAVDPALYKEQQQRVKEIAKRFTEVQEIVARYEGMLNRVNADLDIAKTRLNEINATKGPFDPKGIEEQKEIVNNLQKDFTSVTKETAKYEDNIKKTNYELDITREKLNDILASEDYKRGQQMTPLGPAEKVNEETDKLVENTKENIESVEETAEEVTKKVGFHMDKLTRRIVGLAKRVFIFTLITKALRNIRSYYSSILGKNDELSQSLNRLKAAALTFAQPIVNVIIPVATRIINLLAIIIGYLTRAIATLFGFNIADWAAQAEAGYNSVKKGAEEAAEAQKELNKQLAAFDELNVINSDSEPDTSGVEAATGSKSPDWGFVNNLDAELERLSGIIIGAALVIGTILVMTGVNIPLGLTMMVVGALLLFSEAQTNNELQGMLRTRIGGLIVFTSAVLMALGAVLMFTGANISLGLGMFVLGAIGMFTVASANWDRLGDTLGERIRAIIEYMAIALGVIGLILVFTGHWAIGLALLITAYTAYSASINWDSLGSTLQEKLMAIGMMVSNALMVIGVILMFAGKFGLGITMVIVGYTAGAMLYNWDSLGETMLQKVQSIVAIISKALFFIGVVCVFMGRFGIGLSLIVTSFIADEVVDNWDLLGGTMEQTISTLVDIVMGFLPWFGIILCLMGHIPLGLGIIGVYGIWEVANVDWDALGGSMSATIDVLIGMIKDFLPWFGIILCIMGHWALGLGILGAYGIWALVDADWGSLSENVSDELNTCTDVIDPWLDNTEQSFNDMFYGIQKDSSILDVVWNKLGQAWDWAKGLFSDVNLSSNTLYVGGYASGTVVPPNHRFLGMLGDNVREPEVVSPLSTMKQALGEAMVEYGGAAGSKTQEELLRQLINVVSSKELVVSPSVNLAKVIDRSNNMYRGVTG